MVSATVRAMPFTYKCIIAQMMFCLIFLFSMHALMSRNCTNAEASLSESRAREIQNELKTYRSQLESKAELLKRINTHQRTEENLNAALAHRELTIEELREDYQLLEKKYNATIEKRNAEDEGKSEESKEDKAEKEVGADQNKKDSLSLPNSLTRESAPVGTPVCIVVPDDNTKELDKTLETIMEYIPATSFPIFVSQKGTNEEVANLIRSYIIKEGSPRNVFHLQYIKEETKPVGPIAIHQPDDVSSHSAVLPTMSSHVHWSLSMLFDTYAYNKVMLIDDYLEIAFDFYDYIQASSRLLDLDASIMCVSAWNENGQADFAKDSGNLLRTNVFPDLAWMISTDYWREMKSDWPEGDYRIWLRNRNATVGRSCVVPEVCRVKPRMGSIIGQSDEQFYKKYLSKTKLNKNPVKFSPMDLDYLTKTNYEGYIAQLLSASTEVESASALKDHRGKPGDLKLKYEGNSGYVAVARILGLSYALKDGRPPASYEGIVIIRYGTWRLFIVPSSWESADTARSAEAENAT
mmetsp:Transcript_22707/g.33862  ORF Transcript_22707/g.33862 Transcript_22707/m.33862 type:complete len:522 (+) Transcript_22707:47-1612(+)